jgi:hypothetical protein
MSQKPPDPNDRGSADAGPVVNLTIGEVGAVEQTGDVPTLGECADFGRRAEVEQQPAHLVPTAGRQQGIAQLVRQVCKVTGRLQSWFDNGHRCSNVLTRWDE